MKKTCLGIATGAIMLMALSTVGNAEGNSNFGAVGLETKLDNSIVVYTNDFSNEAAFNALYNKDVDYGIHNINSQGGVKFTYKTDFTKKLNEKYYVSTQIRAFNGDSTKKSKGFWIDLDKVLEDYGPGAYTFSFRTSMGTGHGLVEACLNTLEDQSQLGEILWTPQATPSEYVNFGGHVLCRKWDESGDVLSKTFTSTTYIPEGAEHLRFFFGGSVYDSATQPTNSVAYNQTVGGSAWVPVFFDDLVITKIANSYEDSALTGGSINLKSTITPLNGVESVTGKLISAMYNPETNKLLNMVISDEMIISEKTTVSSSLPYPDSDGYIIKTFFFDSLDNISPYTLSYNPHASLFTNVSFESPYDTYRWMKDGTDNCEISTDVAYSGKRSVTCELGADTWIRVANGAVAPADRVVASETNFAKAVKENGKGKYKLTFMAKTDSENVPVKAKALRYVQPSKTQDVSPIGNVKLADAKAVTSDTVTVTPEWTKVELVLDVNPSDVWGGDPISYRNNNFALFIIANNTSEKEDEKIYIDDFMVTKISD